MKLSERFYALIDDTAPRMTHAEGVTAVRELEADLEAERSRAQDLAARLDRARTERDEARAERNFLQGRALHWMAGMAVVHFFDLARMHALEDAVRVFVRKACRAPVVPAPVDTRTGEVTRGWAVFLAERDAQRSARGPASVGGWKVGDACEARDVYGTWHAATIVDLSTLHGVEEVVECSLANGRKAFVDVGGLRRPAPEATQEWAVGDACEVQVDIARLPGKVVGFVSGDILVEADDDIVRASKRDLRRPIPPTAMEPRRNGGTICDNDDGPCACGAWHKPTEARVIANPVRCDHGNVARTCEQCARTIDERIAAAAEPRITDDDHELEDLARRRVTERSEASAPTVTATFAPGWKGGDACEVIMYRPRLGGTEWIPATVVGFEVPKYIIVEVEGREVRATADEIRRSPVDDRDTRIADLERRLREARDAHADLSLEMNEVLPRPFGMTLRGAVVELRSRAARAEEKLRCVREWCVRATGSHAWALADVLAILDGGES